MDISLMPTPALQKELVKPTGVFPSYLVMAELQKRVTMKQQGDAQKAQGPTVAQQLAQEPTAYAQGGVVKFADAGYVKPDPEEDRKAIMGFLRGAGNIASYPYRIGADIATMGPRATIGLANSAIRVPRAFGLNVPFIPVDPHYTDNMMPFTFPKGSAQPAATPTKAVTPEAFDLWGGVSDLPQPKKDEPAKPESKDPEDEGGGSASVRAGIGAFASPAAPDLSQFKMPEMPTPTKAARPDFEKIRAGISLPDRTEGISRGIAAMEGRVNDAEKNNFRNALLEFGLGALSSKSPWTSVGVGEAGLGALKGKREAEAAQDKQRMELLRAQGDVARMQGDTDRAALQAAGQNYQTDSQAANIADTNSAHLAAAQYQGAVQGRNTDVNATMQRYQADLQYRASMAQTAERAKAQGDMALARTLYQWENSIQRAGNSAYMRVLNTAKAGMGGQLEITPDIEMHATMAKIQAEREAIDSMPPKIRAQFDPAGMRARAGGSGGLPSVNTPPPGGAIRQP